MLSDQARKAAQYFDRHGGPWIDAYDPDAPLWREHEPLRWRERHALSMIRNNSRTAVALDLGCGIGHTVRELAQMGFHKVIGIDASQRMLDRAARTCANGHSATIELTLGDACHLAPLKSASVDTCVALGLIEYIEDDRQLMREIFRVLKPGGQAVIQARNPLCVRNLFVRAIVAIWPSLDRPIWYRYHKPSELRRKAVEVGFTVRTGRYSHLQPLFLLVKMPLIGRAVAPFDRAIKNMLERFGCWKAAAVLASMYILDLEKPWPTDSSLPLHSRLESARTERPATMTSS